MYSTDQRKTPLKFLMVHSCLDKTVSVEMGEYSVQCILKIYVEIGTAFIELLPAHWEKNTCENHQPQNKNVSLYHKALKML